MVEVAEEFVEAVVRGQVLIQVAEMVLAELAGGIAKRLQQLRDGRIELGQPFLRARQTDLGEAGADGRLAVKERRTTGGTALLAVPVREQRTLFRDAIDVRRFIAHHALVVGADVPEADVVAPDDEDVGFLLLRGRGECEHNQHHCYCLTTPTQDLIHG